MKIPSINFNESGRFLTFAINYYNLAFFIAVSIPYPWYGRYMPVDRLVEPVVKWHIRYKVLQFVIYKPKSLEDKG